MTLVADTIWLRLPHCLPKISRINRNSSAKSSHDKHISLVDRMCDLHKKENSLPPSAERERIEREIAVTDEKIDDIVYGLYGVTEGESVPKRCLIYFLAQRTRIQGKFIS